ncbi:hypothetical protein [Geovibrio thiophilus]|uniref:hypothetical protein n=1 Tax=Geovibrio thiophilus TaxID=139438 RepID=UPI0019D45F70|nr:hypothetical protein [Geovibrio thiophilus]
MGRDLTLYPEDASKNDLKKYLESWGFIKCGHLWDWPQGTLNYSWFVYDEFKSIDGVSADIFPVVGDDESITKSKWALHVRNTYSASWHDVKMLNDVLRGARKLFGGIIKGDYGTNRYAPLWEDKSSPLSRGLTSTFRHVEQQIKMLELSLPDGLMQFNKHEPENKVFKWMQTSEPRRILYNGLVPFAVSIFEFFFSQSFQILIKYDEFAINKLQKHSMKVEFADILNISEGHLSIEQLSN